MSLPRFVLVACCSLIAARGAATDLLLPGDYHGDEITAEDGTTWFALVQDEHGGARLEARRVGIEFLPIAPTAPTAPTSATETPATGRLAGDTGAAAARRSSARSASSRRARRRSVR